MNDKEIEKCTHCGSQMKKWQVPDNSTWSSNFQWVCFNDECPYFARGWDHMMKTQNIKASYRQRRDPESKVNGPLPCWSLDAHKDQIIDD